MPSSVQLNEDSSCNAIPGGGMAAGIRPGLRVAAVLAAMTTAAQAQDSTFDGEAGDGTNYSEATNWLGDVYPGDDLGGNGIVFDIDLPGGDPFDILLDAGVTGINGLDNTVDNLAITFSDGGGSFVFDPTSTIDTGTGSFTFDVGVTFLGDVTFNLNETGSVLFNDTVEFGQSGVAGGVATFNSGTATFAGDVTVNDAFGFIFDDGVQVNFGNVDFLGSSNLFFENSGDSSSAVFGGNVGFVDGAALTIGGNDAGATATFSGDVTLAGAFSLLVTGGQTVNWSAGTEFAGDLTIDTTGAGDASVTFSGSRTWSLANGFDEMNINVTTDGADEVTILGTVFNDSQGGIFNFNLSDASTLNIGTILSGQPGIEFHFDLGDSAEVVLNTIDPTGAGVANANNFAFQSLNDAEGAGGVVSTDGDFDALLFIRGGTFHGSFVNNGTANFEVNWAQGESRYNGSSDYQGTYRVRNEAVHRLGFFDAEGDPLANIRASLDGISLFAVLQATAYLENADVATAAGGIDPEDDAVLSLGSGNTSAATLVIENDSTLHARGNFTTDAASVLMITGESTAAPGGSTDGRNLLVDGVSTLAGTIDISATSDGVTENARFVGASTLSGSLTQSSTSYVSFGDTLDLLAGGQWSLTETATGLVEGDFTVAGLLNLEGTSADGLQVDGSTTVSSGGQIQLLGSRTMNVGGDFTLETGGTVMLEKGTGMTIGGDYVGDGTLVIEASDSDASTFAVTGSFTSSGSTRIEAGTTLSASSLVLTDGAIMEFDDLNLEDATTVVVDLQEGVSVGSGAQLFGSGVINLNLAGGDEDFTVAGGGILSAGAIGATQGLLEINGGDLVTESDSVLRFGVNGDIAQATNGIGESSIIDVAGEVVFENGTRLEVDVQQGAYIPTSPTQGIAGGLEFVLLEADDFVNSGGIDLEAGSPSITRDWIFEVEDNAGGPDRILASSTADYTNTLSGNQFAIGELLNSFREPANFDPTGVYGSLLGQLDAISTASAYQAAILGLEPTAQISAIQTAALSQYHDVLRQEIRRRFVVVERRSPAPFRLGDSFELAGQEAVVDRSIRRQLQADPTAEGFGAFWGRRVTTPSDDGLVGLDGNEYGGIGGFGWRLSDRWTGGVDIGYSAIMGNLVGGYGTSRIGTVRGGGFLTWASGDGLFLDMAVSGGWNNYNFDRLVPNTNLSNESNADGFQIDGTVGVGYRMPLAEGFAFTPTGSFLYSYINTGSIDEQTSSNPTTAAGLSIDPGDLSSFIGRVGGEISWSVLPGMVVDGRLGWQGNFTDNGNYDVGLANQAAAVPIIVENQTINTAYYGAGLNWNVAEQIDVNLQWEGRSGDGLNSQMFIAGVTISF